MWFAFPKQKETEEHNNVAEMTKFQKQFRLLHILCSQILMHKGSISTYY